jgi:hypothetical protein
MTRVLRDHIVAAERKLARFKHAQKQAVVAKIFREQPHLLSFIASLSQRGPSREGITFLYHVLVVCYQAMQESGGSWGVVSEAEQEQLLTLMIAELDEAEPDGDSDEDLDHTAESQRHPERFLRRYVRELTTKFIAARASDEDRRSLAIAATALVEGIATAGSKVFEWHQNSAAASSVYSATHSSRPSVGLV